MAAPSGKFFGLGFRSVTIFELDDDGLPAAPSTAVYEGIEFVGPKALELTNVEPRVFHHTGADGVLDVDVLPALEGARGVLRLGRVDMAAEAVVGGLVVETIGEALALLGGINDQVGFEPQVGMFAMRQSHSESGQRHWDSRIMPMAVLSMQEDAWNEGGAQERAFAVTPSIVGKHLWGPAFSIATNGTTKAQFVRLMTLHRAKLVAWQGNGTADEFSFPATKKPVSEDKIHLVTKAGAAVTTGLTKTVDKLTFTVAPADEAIICALYEY